MQKLRDSEFNLRQTLESEEDQVLCRRYSFFLSLQNWEYLGLLLNFVQMAMVILAFTPGSPLAPPRCILVMFPLWYVFELVNRAKILSSQNEKGYMHNLLCSERPRYILMHKVDAALTATSLFCAFLCMFFSSRPLDLFANVSVWRVFVIHPSLRNILFCCSQGVAPLRLLFGLATIVYYYFCLVFYEICRVRDVNSVTREVNGNHNFDTLRDTFLTMYQILLGNIAYVCSSRSM